MKTISASALGMLLFLPYEGTESAPAAVGRVDVSAILRSWRIKGVLACPYRGKTRPCLWVENAYPCGLIEVVRRPFTSHLVEAEGVLRAVSTDRLTSAGGADRGQTNLQFGDARVYTFLPALPEELELPIAHPRGPFFLPSYVSEMDAWGWRTGLLDRVLRPARSTARCDLAPDPESCAGRWGSYYPREGYLIHQSEPMASLVQALRAGRVASDPVGRFVLNPYPFEPRTGHFIQMIRPVTKRAIRIGQPGPVDEGAGSIDGAYLYVHMGIFEECRRCLPPRLVGTR